MRIILAVLALLATAPTLAGGRGGHLTTFDANLFGGPANVICIDAPATPGVCTVGESATCNGIADDSVAVAAARVAATARNPALTVLYISPGKFCHVTAPETYIWDGNAGSSAFIQNAVVWGYGSNINQAIVVQGMFQDCSHSSRLTVGPAAGATSITVSPTMIDGSTSTTGVFPAGTWMLMSGLSAYPITSFPPVFQRFEYVLSTGQVGNVVSLAQPLANSYETTWPDYNNCAARPGDGDLAGPATIYKLPPSWNVHYAFYGLTFPSGAGCLSGRFNAAYDSVFAAFGVTCTTGTFSSTLTQESWVFSSYIKSGELDKEIGNFNFINSNGGWSVQSSSTTNINVVNSLFDQGLVGTAGNVVISNSTFPSGADFGPTNFGVSAGAIKVDGSFFSSCSPATCFHNILASPVAEALSDIAPYSNGTFTVNLSPVGTAPLFFPGFTYTITGHNGLLCSPSFVFKITDLTATTITTTQWTNNGVAMTGGFGTDGSAPSTAAFNTIVNTTLASPNCSGLGAERISAYSSPFPWVATNPKPGSVAIPGGVDNANLMTAPY